MRTCTRCKTTKAEDQFYRLKTGYWHSWCRTCCSSYGKTPEKRAERAARTRKSYAKHRQVRLATTAKYRATAIGSATLVLDNARQRAKRNGRTFDLDRDWVLERLDKPCPLTGWAFEFGTSNGDTRVNPRAPSIDRLDNAKGYTKDNCRVICAQANLARNAFSDAQLIELARAITETISSQDVALAA